MTKEEAIQHCKIQAKMKNESDFTINNYILGTSIEIVLSLIQKQQEEIEDYEKTIDNLIKEQKEREKYTHSLENVLEKKDNKVKSIIERLDNDIKNITKTKAKKSRHYLDDYTRCRLKAYRTKTREIRDYISEQYFESKV